MIWFIAGVLVGAGAGFGFAALVIANVEAQDGKGK